MASWSSYHVLPVVDWMRSRHVGVFKDSAGVSDLRLGHGDAFGQELEVGKLVDNGHEDVVLRLLLTGKLVEGHDAGVRLGGGVFHFAIDPAFLDLLLHPGNVGCLGSEVAHRVEVNPHPSGGALPFGGVLPGGLAEVAQGGTVGGVDFVANLGDLFVVHGFPFRGMGVEDGQDQLLGSGM